MRNLSKSSRNYSVAFKKTDNLVTDLSEATNSVMNQN